MPTRRINATAILMTLIFIIIALTGWLIYTQLRTDAISSQVDSGEVVRTLFVAYDGERPFLTFLLVYHPGTRRAAMLDIPGNVGMVLQPLGRIDRIDTIFDGSDPTAFLRAVEETAGISIPHWIVMNEGELIDFIDLLGGMELFIINDYRDLEESEPVLLPTGSARLNGGKAVQYLRLAERGPALLESELERVGRRQSFVQGLFRSIKESREFLRHPDVVEVRSGIVKSSLERRALTAFFDELAEVDPDRLVRRRIQGTVRDVDVEGTTKQLLFPHFEGQWLRQAVRQMETTLATPEEEIGEETLVTMEVLNGTSSSGLARRTSELYEDFGFEVLRFGNAESDQIEHTLVIDRRGIGETAERVARVIEADRIVVDVSDETDVDVTVILGRDFDGTTVRSR